MGTNLTAVFTSQRTEWMISPEIKGETLLTLKDLQWRVPQLSRHIWILSSGSTGLGIKAIAHTKEGFLKAAAAANQHLQSHKKDVWLNVLPTYHVGGLAIFARGHLSGARVVDHSTRKWNSRVFAQSLRDHSVTLTSLVPTQVFDLVKQRLEPSSVLRAVIVGGGNLSEELYREARDLGWPLLPSYGLTELGSQVATAALESLRENEYPSLQPLSHVKLQLREGLLQIFSSAICEWVAVRRPDGSLSLESGAPNAWFRTEDLAELSKKRLKILGRRGDLLKVMGTLVNVLAVERQLQKFMAQRFSDEVCVLAAPDKRRENSLVAVTSSNASIFEWESQLAAFNKQMPGPQRITNIYFVEALPKSSLGKLLQGELRTFLGL